MLKISSLVSGIGLLLSVCCCFWQCAPSESTSADTTASTEPAKDTLSFCLLNYYEPLSDEKRGGIYEDYATYLAERLDKVPKFVYLNSAYFNRPVRDGIRKGICDCQMGHPIEEEEPWLIPKKVRQSHAYTSIGYALATADPEIQDLEDLAGKRVVAMAQAPPMTTLGDLEDIRLQIMINEQKMMELLDQGEVDAVVAWGPKLYQLNQDNFDSRFKVYNTSYMWKVAILTQDKDSVLMDEINGIIDEQPGKFQAIAAAYGL
ncbi:substrate-binding periplasmic protein [Flavilitoribacter nigricans]|uniref:Uncharacterized protein n=1 Tax=Flavilitoribacter nigricans (strain ATCC 23147 / DSM 23189 / NBRC 102662 / NCIMB 1420 / SS-2) TaxID=1122177 RepID=A0A2D0NJS9_FLAN2|nr:transporter substrate-binding domain-containing protein [Flavilitoribacter nigricans]PHN08459.1 hypothetical protein CRP01_00670 [Flavilitoribacter nigricans DSM 23189 = NBRC 102662]